MTTQEAPEPGSTWLLTPENGKQFLEQNQFIIGRSSVCDYVVNSDLASRKHLRLQYDEHGGYWLAIDLGSTNGTHINGIRLTAPRKLNDGDRIEVGEVEMVFHRQTDNPITQTPPDADQTVLAIHSEPCWLLLLDVKQSTQWIQRLSPEEYSRRMRLWSQECERIVRRFGGMVNEYLGDGMLVFFRNSADAAIHVADTLERLQCLRSASGLEFRGLCHFGVVAFGGGISSSLEKLSGSELNFIFKAEKPAASSGHKLVLTNNAASSLNRYLECAELGEFEVTGFEGMHRFYTPVAWLDASR